MAQSLHPARPHPASPPRWNPTHCRSRLRPANCGSTGPQLSSLLRIQAPGLVRSRQFLELSGPDNREFATWNRGRDAGCAAPPAQIRT